MASAPPIIQRRNKLHPPPRSTPARALLTLDLLIHVLSRTLFHPFLAALLPLCLRALAAPYNSTSFILTSAFAICVCLYSVLQGVNNRLAYGPPREINWEDEVVVITGGVGGLGGCLAEIFALRGVGVAVLDVEVPPTWAKAEGLAKGPADGEEREGVRYYYCDVGNYEQVERVWDTVVRAVGTPTVLINNAAVVNCKGLMEQSGEAVERTFRINTLSHYHLNKLFLQPMLGKSSHSGTIVTVSSVLGQLGAADLSAYTASKAALLAYHASLTSELASKAPSVKTILVATGQLDTQMFGNVRLRGWSRNFFGPVVGAGDVAVKIVDMIDRGEGGVVSEPAYARWIAWLGVLPVGLQRLAKSWAGLDDAFTGNVHQSSKAAGQ
ncbi:putative short-chain dehydrogenase/reductase family protein [Usnea florida]